MRQRLYNDNACDPPPKGISDDTDHCSVVFSSKVTKVRVTATSCVIYHQIKGEGEKVNRDKKNMKKWKQKNVKKWKQKKMRKVLQKTCISARFDMIQDEQVYSF
jgi:hypothetical protein